MRCGKDQEGNEREWRESQGRHKNNKKKELLLWREESKIISTRYGVLHSAGIESAAAAAAVQSLTLNKRSQGIREILPVHESVAFPVNPGLHLQTK